MKRTPLARKATVPKQRQPLARRAPLASGASPTTLRDVLRGETKPRPPRNTGPTVTVRKAVSERAGGACERCGKTITGEYSVHHRKPRGMGGTKDPAANSPANLVLLCGSATTPDGCHTGVERFRQSATNSGWIVPRAADPAKIPVKRHDGWFLLNHDGTKTPTTRPVE